MCVGPCQEGYYCPLGSVSATVTPCGAVTLYCPLGSAAAMLVPTGWYSTPEEALDTVRSGAVPCEPGWYCFGARRSLCPNGTYSGTFGAATCEVCPAGKGLQVIVAWWDSLGRRSSQSVLFLQAPAHIRCTRSCRKL